MIKSAIDPVCTGQFSPIFLDYIQQKDSLQPFYDAYPSLKNLHKTAEARTFDKQGRELLADSLQEQYAGFQLRELSQSNLNRLRLSNTFTVTTGHQLNL